MKKRIIQINGFRGLLMFLFIVACLIAGFVCFPAFLCMSTWNYISAHTSAVVPISFWGGLLLWGIIVVCFLITSKRRIIVGFDSAPTYINKEETAELLDTYCENPEEFEKKLEKILNKNSEQ